MPLILGCKEVSASGVITMVFNRPVQLNYDYVLDHYSQGRKLTEPNNSDKEFVNQVLKNAFKFEFTSKSDQFLAELIDFNVLEFRDAQEIDI